MVRGRRVRAVVAYASSDDCCSPNPKRKDQRIDVNTKLPHALLPSKRSQTITQFFQTVSADIDYSKPIVLENLPLTDSNVLTTHLMRKNLEELVNIKELAYKDVEKFDLNKTLEGIEREVTSPLTPHRIELCTDNDSSQNPTDNNEQTAPLPQYMPPPKARCRFNQDLNQETNPREKNGNIIRKLTDYFPVRRSARKTKKTVLEEKQRSLERAVCSGIEDGLEVHTFDDKGRGVVATRVFHKGDFVVEYSGELVDINEAKQREQKYAEDQSTGCYMYYFKHKNQQYCIDATTESGRLGRLVNHSRNGNLLTRTITVDNKPRLVLIAKNTIQRGDEVTYDYGDRSKESLKHHPWLAL